MGNRVGVVPTRSVAGPLALGPDPGPVFLVALVAERGPINVPTLVTSMSRVQAIFGGATPFATDTTHYSAGWQVLNAFFAKGGRRAYVLRIAGATAETTEVTLQDQGGAPQDTLTVRGKGPGTYLDGWTIKTSAGTRLGTFKLEVISPDTSVVERFDNLKITDTDLARVNNGSTYLQLANAGSTNAAPDNLPEFADRIIDTDTDGGVDDNEPVAADIVGTDTAGVKTGLKALRGTYGYGFIAAPDLDGDPTVQAELIEQSEDRYRVWLTSSQAGADVASAKTQRAAIDAFNALFYYPRARVRDRADGSIRTIPVVGHVAADWIEAIASIGPGKTPGGRNFRIDANIIGMETQTNGTSLIDAGVAEDLVANGVNPVWDKDGAGARVWGVRAATNDPAWTYIHAAYLWCVISARGSEALDVVVLDVADDLFFTNIELGLYSLLADLHDNGAFRGELVSPGETADPAVHSFGIVANEDLLSVQDKESGNVRAQGWFRPAGVAETIFFDVAKQNEVA